MSEPLDFSDGGKHLRTALGWSVRVYATDGSPEHPIHGAYQAPKSGWCGMIWSKEGVAFGRSDGQGRYSAEDYSLVPYVPEPPKPRTQRFVVYLFECPTNYYAALTAIVNGNKAIASKTVEFTEGEFANKPSVPGLVKYQFECEEGQTPVVLVPTGETRPPKADDVYLYMGRVLTALHNNFTCEHPILRRIEPSRV